MGYKKILAGIAVTTLILLIVSSVFSATIQTAHISGLPKVDEILYKAYVGVIPDVIVDEFITGVTDWIGGPARKDLYDRVVAAGHKVSPMDPMAEFGFAPINCRDYKETSGLPNAPLNDSNFRVALSYIYGMDRKAEDIFDYVGAPWVFALGNPVPPAQEPWYDETVVMPDTDWATAWSILEAAGYYIDPTENWLYHNVTGKVRDLEVWYSTGALYWERGPGLGLVTAFNEFITTYLGATGPTMRLAPTDFITLVLDLLVYHDYDIICIGLTGLGVYVDWLYDCLHSENIGVWGWNFGGIVDPDFDAWTETILTSLDESEIIAAASRVQAKFVYKLMPWFPMSSGLEFCTVARDERGELMNLISMPNYGPRNDYSWMTLHWKGTPDVVWPGGTLKTALGDAPHTMNPYTEDTLYGWQFLDRAIEGLLARNPETLKLMPWIATDYIVEPWVSIPELGIEEGSMATFWIRQDVVWHDGEPLDAYDCVNNMRIMREYKPGRYSSVWANLVYEEADGPYKFNVYFYTPSLYYAIYVAGTALLAPKHITDLVEKQVEEGVLTRFFDWTPCDKTYEELTGEPSPPDYPCPTQLVGTGPYVFDYYDRSLATGRVFKNEHYWISAPAIGGVVGDWRIDPDTTYTYKALVQNIAAKNNTEEGECVDITVDVNIYEDDVLTYTVTGLTLPPWNHTYLGPYTTGVLAGGVHTIKVEVLVDGSVIHTYVHTFVAVPREDVSTYSGDLIDCFIDIKDILRAAIAYGSYPGSLRWDPPCDVNEDFFVDIKDILAIAIKYGWSA